MSERGRNDNADETPQQQKLNKHIKELLAERNLIEESKCPHLYKLVSEEIDKVQASGKVPFKDSKFVDVYRERPVKVSTKVLVPVREHPRYNFVGKLLGPKGSTLKQLQEETMCHISICGRGSIRDQQKEEDLRQSLDPKFAHLQDELHVNISTLGPPAEAHARLAFALAEIRKYLIPEYVEGGRQEPLMDVMSKPSPLMRDDRSGPPRKPGLLRGPPQRGGARPPMSRMPPKPKMMSILDRAGVMEDYDEEYDPAEQEYAEYRGGYSGNSRSTYHPPARNYGDSYDQDYYREHDDSYGMSDADYGYKKRKTYMD